MKGIIWRFKKFESEDAAKSTLPKGIWKHREFKKGAARFSDVIGVWLCIEKDDKEEYLKSLIKRIIELDNQYYNNLKKIVILPFAHLSNKLESPEKSKELLEKLREELREKGFEVYRMSFGTRKRLLFETRGQAAECCYFEFPHLGEKTQSRL